MTREEKGEGSEGKGEKGEGNERKKGEGNEIKSENETRERQTSGDTSYNVLFTHTYNEVQYANAV